MKFDHFRVRRRLEFAPRKSIEPDEIDFCRNAVKPFDKEIGIVRTVIETFDDDIFERDALPGVERKSAQRVKKRIERPDAVGGHDLAAKLIACGVEAYGQVNAQTFARKRPKPRNMPNRRKRYFSARKVERLRVKQNL